jgi:hypothetical protein
MPILAMHDTRVPVTIVTRHDDGRATIRFRDGSDMTVPGDLLETGDGETDLPPVVARWARLTDHQELVLAALDRAGALGLTDDEHEERNGLRSDSAGKRRLDMQRRGYVTDTGDRRTTRRGKNAAIFQITEAGRDALRRHHLESIA